MTRQRLIKGRKVESRKQFSRKSNAQYKQNRQSPESPIKSFFKSECMGDGLISHRKKSDDEVYLEQILPQEAYSN